MRARWLSVALCLAAAVTAGATRAAAAAGPRVAPAKDRAGVISQHSRAEVAQAPPTRPKHVLFFLIDDLGAADVGYAHRIYPELNASLAMPTPTIDALAGDGVALSRYYVTQLCSPSRTSLLSGRYPYTIGMNDEVIVNGHPSCLPLNYRLLTDQLKEAPQSSWSTAMYGKYDLGMTSWGCTPTCRGFDHFYGFYNAFNDYFSHIVGVGLDLHNDKESDFSNRNQTGVYMTELITTKHIEWIRNKVATDPSGSTFSLVAHESNHAPTEVPLHYINHECDHIPASNPTRRIVCGMMRAVDSSLANITAVYKELGIWDDTLVIFSTDNGGNPNTGGNNYPLRGAKATAFEGGVRGAGFVSGAGLQPSVRGTVSSQLLHISDWYPTIVGGIAGFNLSSALLPTDPSMPAPRPLDGVDQWEALSTGSPSQRQEMLLNLQPTTCNGEPCNIPGEGAYLSGKWKLVYGHTVVWGKGSGTSAGNHCMRRSGEVDPKSSLPINASTSEPWCPTGWVPAPESGMAPVPPPEADATCPGGQLPCDVGNTTNLVGGTWLFDVESDPYEQHNVAAQNPQIVAQLMAKLQAFNATQIPQDNFPTDPLSDPARFGYVWTPWRGDPDPAKCSKNTTGPPGADLRSNVDGVSVVGNELHMQGWCWEPSSPNGGRYQLHVEIHVDGSLVQSLVANVSRPGLPSKTGAPDPNHGFMAAIPPGATGGNLLKGKHEFAAFALVGAPAMRYPRQLAKSPVCLCDAKPCPCGPLSEEEGGMLPWQQELHDLAYL